MGDLAVLRAAQRAGGTGLLARFAAKIEVVNGHWLWRGYITPQGYGSLNIAGQPQPAHRVSYELFRGAIPGGKEIDHLAEPCGIRACSRPDHLEAVTHQVNVQRGNSPSALLHRAGHCRRGHPFSPENTLYRRDGRVHSCRVCDREGRVA